MLVDHFIPDEKRVLSTMMSVDERDERDKGEQRGTTGNKPKPLAPTMHCNNRTLVSLVW